MRDKLKDIDYWNRYISMMNEIEERSLTKLNKGLIAKDRINISKQARVYSCLTIISAKYSAGYPPQELKQDLIHAINLTDESWDGTGEIYYKGRYLKQLSLSSYDEMLWMLSLGYLLDIPDKYIHILTNVIDRYQAKDFLLEFLIRAKIKERQPIMEESYERFFGIPNIFSSLRQAIIEVDKENAETLVDQFITKEWYKGHKDSGWYNNHKNDHHDVYCGYWCFEAAAVVKIMRLNDSNFKDCQYYPKDLINV